jgi:hypothetical protein
MKPTIISQDRLGTNIRLLETKGPCVYRVCFSVRVGCWNEAPWSADYIVTLRHSLDKAGLNDVKITAADGSTTVIAAAAKNKTLADAIESFGIHTHVLAPDAEINRWNGAGNH